MEARPAVAPSAAGTGRLTRFLNSIDQVLLLHDY
jgi:hypothetical protein